MFCDTKEMKKGAAQLKALGNYYRLQIVCLLLNGEKNVSELNKTVKVSQPALSQHLSKLKREGILASRREQRQIFYFITNPRVASIIALTEQAVKPAEKK